MIRKTCLATTIAILCLAGCKGKARGPTGNYLEPEVMRVANAQLKQAFGADDTVARAIYGNDSVQAWRVDRQGFKVSAEGVQADKDVVDSIPPGFALSSLDPVSALQRLRPAALAAGCAPEHVVLGYFGTLTGKPLVYAQCVVTTSKGGAQPVNVGELSDGQPLKDLDFNKPEDLAEAWKEIRSINISATFIRLSINPNTSADADMILDAPGSCGDTSCNQFTTTRRRYASGLFALQQSIGVKPAPFKPIPITAIDITAVAKVIDDARKEFPGSEPLSVGVGYADDLPEPRILVAYAGQAYLADLHGNKISSTKLPDASKLSKLPPVPPMF